VQQTILIADDDPEFLSAVKKELESRSFQVVTASNGMVAVRQAQKLKPALIILDVAMPMTSGFQAFQTIRAVPELNKTPVIFLTGIPSAEVYPVLQQGANVAHLKKPVDLADLLSLIQQLLNKPA
jgi:CheY-like chemotaxis protein